MKKRASLLFLSFSALSEGKDLGVYGTTFEIKEKDLKEVLVQRSKWKVENEGLLRLQEQQVQVARQRVEMPLAGRFLSRSENDTVRYYDPTYVLRQNLQDEKGRIFAFSGTTVNPLDYVSLSKKLVFINAEDDQQRNWLVFFLKHNTDFLKIILVKGNPVGLEEFLNRPVYFDQKGVLAKKLGIQYVPCVVEQQKNKLKIKEFALTNSYKLMSETW